MNNDIAARMYPSSVDPKPAPLTSESASALPRAARPSVNDDLASRMFPAMDEGTVRQEETPNAPKGTFQSDEQQTVDEVACADEGLAERMYADGGPVLDSAEAYSGATLAATFDQLEHQARHEQNQADIEALANGRREASELLFEWSVPADHAHEIATEPSSWHDRWMRDELPDMDKIADNGAKAHSELQKAWGRQYDANLAFARTAYQQAAKRLPWLSELVDAGAGNSAVLIKQFAAIGRRQARAAKRGAR